MLLKSKPDEVSHASWSLFFRSVRREIRNHLLRKEKISSITQQNHSDGHILGIKLEIQSAQSISLMKTLPVFSQVHHFFGGDVKIFLTLRTARGTISRDF